MKDLENILNKLQYLILNINKIEEDYIKNDRIKGKAYQKRVDYIKELIDVQMIRLKNLGTDGYLYKVELGKIETYREKKYAYFINIGENTINQVCEYRFPGWSVLKKTKISLGELRDI